MTLPTSVLALRSALQDVDSQLRTARATLASTTERRIEATRELDLLGQTDIVLKALLKTRTDSAFKEVEQLLTRGLQTVFGPEWTGVKIVLSQKNAKLWGELLFCQGDIEGPPLEAFGGGPAAVASFLLRVLVVRRTGLAPMLLLDETFSQVSASALPDLAKFLRLLVDRLGMTILLVTHQPLFLDAATRAYRASYEGGQTVFRKLEP